MHTSRLCAIAVCLAAVIVATSAARLPSDAMASKQSEGTARSSLLPVVIWHGMGDSCCSLGSIGAIKKLTEDQLGVFVHSIATGQGEYSDVWSSFFGNLNTQIHQVCSQLRGMEELRGGFHAVGFSQGGQFMRALVERCDGLNVHTLVTMGAQHQGVINTPGCRPLTCCSINEADQPCKEAANHASAACRSWSNDPNIGVVFRTDLAGAAAKACSVMQVLLARGAYAPWVRANVIQAQYFKDPHALQQYLAANIFLPDINNEKLHKNQNYADNLASVKRLVMFRFSDDTTVVPRDSAWFSFYNGTALVPLEEQPLYTEDWIGLKRLHQTGGLVFEEAPGEHMQFTLDWYTKNVIDKYLSGDDPAQKQQQHFAGGYRANC
eukprot:jgi/Chrzof1/1544/Cz10g11240.t1